MTDTLEREQDAAIQAVRQAARVCQAVRQQLVSADTLQKKDRSPVTVADFASQAVVCSHLRQQFPDDLIIAEEDAAELRGEDQATIRDAVVKHVSISCGRDLDADKVLQWIDLGGGSLESDPSYDRYWTLDPIDGTKGFLRNEQYAVALGLIVRGQVVLGVLGCPSLPCGSRTGALLLAVAGQGARIFPLEDVADGGSPIRVSEVDQPSQARFCESVESGHSNQSESAQIAQKLGITAEPVRMDSQAKYATVARGDASVYLRLPTRADYQEKIWDHAAGSIVVQEAGGRVTDITGQPLDFSCGRTLANNRGVVATNGLLHDRVVEVVQQVC